MVNFMLARAEAPTRALRVPRLASCFRTSLHRRERCREFGDLQLDVLVDVALHNVIDEEIPFEPGSERATRAPLL
jgi:hypothetical protein